MQRRGISEEVIEKVMNSPEQMLEANRGRVVLQARLAIGDPRKAYLIRVFVDVDRQPPEVVTAYRTSRIAKYWRVEA